MDHTGLAVSNFMEFPSVIKGLKMDKSLQRIYKKRLRQYVCLLTFDNAHILP